MFISTSETPTNRHNLKRIYWNSKLLQCQTRRNIDISRYIDTYKPFFNSGLEFFSYVFPFLSLLCLFEFFLEKNSQCEEGFKLDHPQWWKRRGSGERRWFRLSCENTATNLFLVQPELLGWHRSNPWENPENSVKNGGLLLFFFCFFVFFCECLCVAKAFSILNKANLLKLTYRKGSQLCS